MLKKVLARPNLENGAGQSTTGPADRVLAEAPPILPVRRARQTRRGQHLPSSVGKSIAALVDYR
jgi:hypothetical protein